MAVTPLLFLLSERVLEQSRSTAAEPDFETPENEENQVIIAGFGRFGQIVGRMLRAKKIGFTALEISPEQVDFVTKYGNKVYYGDASRLDLLTAARADQAVIFVLAIDDIEASLRTAETVIKHFPHLRIFARARNRQHAYKLMDLGLTDINRETFHSSLDSALQVLKGLGLPDYEAERSVQAFKELDEQRLLAQHGLHHDEAKMMEQSKAWAKELEEIFEQDATAGT